ncbi:3,2-trans-enoyl-CoA isomerase, mitochondrial precursor, putative [Trypanosoma brucei brucei TREU927]|uniref:Enoyl-CoA delta isomerase 1, mitochondrial n=1 Tax=Trypanosoma brucei brucei (strain 927/4 GUTat10.1) TaxID=185431 RepID=Q584L4_TRYB2|nr:3,2-trans-enoyl-CoA isomerase, mitochondrial precursor, putative [Trypanosoma brucei brucei TREU927]AAX80537.1 3,2-trans-enoyl-CoA isomerase, mitochondrial precursor, putative [Trypanosoma brucei]AAZ11081.1 3,2-trans-enoyl-CoA isomerase, mitochondrial precursor, putative [Trypanosoma brucei brucei TREU927]
MRRNVLSSLNRSSSVLIVNIGTSGVVPAAAVASRLQTTFHGPPGNVPPNFRAPPLRGAAPTQHQMSPQQQQFYQQQHMQQQEFHQQQQHMQQQQFHQQQHMQQQQQPQMHSSAVGAEAEDDFEPPRKPSEPPRLLRLDTSDRGITTVALSRAPVNSLSLELFEEFNSWMLWLGSDESCKAIILTSSIPTVFSAGLDMSEMHNPEPERLRRFWKSFQETWLILNSFPKPIIGAISGNSPAGGCVLALGCDSRVMVRHPADKPDRPYRIGLNETKLGITTPPWVIPAYAYVLGSRRAERMLQLGETPTADEALRMGLVDLVVDGEHQLREAAVKEVERFLSVPQQSRWMSRDMLRREFLQFIGSEEDREYDTQFFVELMMNPEVQKSLEAFTARLKGKAVRK